MAQLAFAHRTTSRRGFPAFLQPDATRSVAWWAHPSDRVLYESGAADNLAAWHAAHEAGSAFRAARSSHHGWTGTFDRRMHERLSQTSVFAGAGTDSLRDDELSFEALAALDDVPTPLHQDVLCSLVRVFPATLTSEAPSSCSICLCQYSPTDPLIMLPCEHMFHEPCINRWFERSNKCPLCLVPVEHCATQKQRDTQTVCVPSSPTAMPDCAETRTVFIASTTPLHPAQAVSERCAAAAERRRAKALANASVIGSADVDTLCPTGAVTRFPPAQVDRLTMNGDTCPICLEQLPSSAPTRVFLEKCGHGLCRGCAEAYVRSEVLVQGHPNVRCVCCTAELAPHEILALLGTEEACEKYQRFTLNTFVATVDGRAVHCSQAGCTYFAIADADIQYGTHLNCPLCFAVTCAKCGETAHDGACTTSAQASLTSTTALPRLLAERVKKCPRCGVLIEKDPGSCDKMQCRCGHRFCFSCGVEDAVCECTASFHAFWDNHKNRPDFRSSTRSLPSGSGDTSSSRMAYWHHVAEY